MTPTRRAALLLAVLIVPGACARRHAAPPPAPARPPASASCGELCAGRNIPETAFREQYPALWNRDRLRGVHYFQGRWPFTFWDSLRVAELDRDFADIRSHGFNTIVLFLSWGKFQTKMFPPTYDEANLKKLDAVLAAARRNGLWVVLRVGTPESVPSDMPEGSPYNIPDLMFAPRQLDALADLFLTVSKRAAAYDNVFGMFLSWEDFSQYLNLIRADAKTRLEFENRRGLFRAYLKERAPLAEWNRKWGTNYRDFSQIPLPAMQEPALADYVDMIAHYVNGAILAKMRTAGNVGLGYELRLDKEAVKIGGELTWHGYEAGFRLPPQFTFIAAYYNPFWGAPNDGGFIAPAFAQTMSQRLIHGIQSEAGDTPIFVEQLNLADDTPLFTRSNSKLRYPADEAEAVRTIVPVLFERTLGYSIWTYRDYVGNVVADSSFLVNRGAWSAAIPLTYRARPDGEKDALLVPGQTVKQTIVDYFNPGKSSDAPYRFDVEAALPAGTQQAAMVTVALGGLQGRTVTKQLFVVPGPMQRYAVPFGEVGNTVTAVSIATPAFNKVPVEVGEVRVWNHLMATGVVDRDGEARRSRAIAYETQNRAWSCFESGAALPANYEVVQRGESCADCPGVFDDGWGGRMTTLPFYLPFAKSDITVEAFIPDSVKPPAGLRLDVWWLDAPKNAAGATRVLQPGLNVIHLPAPPNGTMLGDRTLVVRSSATFRTGKDQRDLAFRLVRFGDTAVKPLAIGEPAEGEYVAAIPNASTNAVIVDGRVSGSGRYVVTVEPRGHFPRDFTIETGGEFHLQVPLWAERLGGKPEVFLQIRRLSGSGQLRVTRIAGENERTPDTVYR